jgi:ADP-dependent phosphofructokinase/glucokinase
MSGELVLGLGGTVDYEIVWDDAVVEALAREFGIVADELTTAAPIIDERSLVVTVLGFLGTGGGGERFVASELVESFARRFEKKVTLGGTGVRAGLALARLGVPTVQHLVSTDDTVRRLLPAQITVVSSADEDTLDPHLIVQYPAGARVELADGTTLVAPHPNRLIFADDPPNRSMALSSELPAALADARVVLLSGFNTMRDARLLESRLIELRHALDALPSDSIVMYEDAGFYEPGFRQRVRRHLLDRIDVYSMNEDEAADYLDRTLDLADADAVTAALANLQPLIPVPALVVHSRLWALGVGPRAPRYADALESAVRMAATRYRVGDDLSAQDFDETAALTRDPDGARVVEAVIAADPRAAAGAAAFRLDHVERPTTIGLGDSFVGGFLAALARELDLGG